MSHSYTRVYIHYGWSTKNGQRLLSGSVRAVVQHHMQEYACANNIGVIALNVQPEHVHLLVRLGRS